MTARTDDKVPHPDFPGFTYGNVKRVFAKVDMTGDCWEWTGCVNAEGYGRVTVNKRSDYAHRMVYRMLVGEPSAGLDLDHLCRNRRCVKPIHLDPVTRAENLRRGESHDPAVLERARRARWDGVRSRSQAV